MNFLFLVLKFKKKQTFVCRFDNEATITSKY